MNIRNMKQMTRRGFSVLEIMLAVGIFAVFASGAVIAVLQGIEMNRLGQEETIAVEYATEGMEAVRSIRNRDFALLENTAGAGIARDSGVWIFSGSEDVFAGKYSRAIVVSDVRRDGSGDIVESGGTVDEDTKRVTATVSWDASVSRHDSVVLTTYLTNWEAPL